VPRQADLPEMKPLTPADATKPLDLKWLTAFLSEGGAMADVFLGLRAPPGAGGDDEEGGPGAQ